MSAVTSNTLLMPTTHATRERWPWVISLLLLMCFAGANWAWGESARWSLTSGDEIEALVGRVSEGTAKRQVAFAALGVIGLAMLMSPGRAIQGYKSVMLYAVMVFIGWALVSITWSVDRGQTAKRLVVFASLCLAAGGLIKQYDPRQLARIAFAVAIATIVIGVGMEIITVGMFGFPGFGKYRFGGMQHPNHAGINCCVAIFTSAYLFRTEGNRTHRLLYALTFVFAAGVLYFTKSRTALMAALTGVGVFWMLASHVRLVSFALLLVAWGAAGVLWLSSMQMLPGVSQFISMGREDVSKADVTQLTGRTDIWHFALVQAARDPNRVFTGYGFESFWTPENVAGVSSYVKFRISEGHNLYLDWYLELGLVGAGLYALLLLWALVRWAIASRVLGSPVAALGAAVLAAVVIHGFAESSCGDANAPGLFVLVTIGCATLRRPDEIGFA